MANDERNLETIPTGALGLIPLASCTELGEKVNQYLVKWRDTRHNAHKDNIAFKDYHRASYIVNADTPRFGSGEAKGVIKDSVRGYDLYIMVDVTNYSMTYSLCGQTNHMSPDDHFLSSSSSDPYFQLHQTSDADHHRKAAAGNHLKYR